MNKFALHGLPRSGSTWIGEILNSSKNVKYGYQPLFSYALKGSVGASASERDINAFYENLLATEDEFICQRAAREVGKLPSFNKDKITHVGYKEVRYHNILPNMIRKSKDIRFFLIERNPFSVIYSWLNAPREFRSDLGWDPMEEWRYAFKKNLNRPEEYNGYERWKEATLMFGSLSKQFSERVMVIRYDEILDDAIPITRDIFKFMGLTFTDQTEEFITTKRKPDDDAYSVNRTKQRDDAWKNKLDPDIVTAITIDLEAGPLSHYVHG